LTNINDFPVRYPVKLENRNYARKILPSGALLEPIGRMNLECQSGFHKWTTKKVLNIPYMTCLRCGYHMPKPVLENTMSRRELLETTQTEMAKEKPKLRYTADPNIRKIDMEKLVVELFENKQKKYKKDKTGKLRLRYKGGEVTADTGT